MTFAKQYDKPGNKMTTKSMLKRQCLRQQASLWNACHSWGVKIQHLFDRNLAFSSCYICYYKWFNEKIDTNLYLEQKLQMFSSKNEKNEKSPFPSNLFWMSTSNFAAHLISIPWHRLYKKLSLLVRPFSHLSMYLSMHLSKRPSLSPSICLNFHKSWVL